MSQAIGLLGSGAQADEIESYLEDGQDVAFRAVSEKYLDPQKPNVINIKDTEKLSTPVIAAVGAPGLKRDMIGAWSGSQYRTLIAKDAHVDAGAQFGEGTVVSPMTVITTNVTLGNHVLVNIGATISHDVTVGDFTTISPGVHIAGKVKIGNGVFIGIGAVISNNLSIADGCVIGAGSVVIHDITKKNSVVVGVPAEIIRTNEDWLYEL
jgi:sugar O-acyltransferase (sialic acid O-acetyltransferase NeuD family)